MIPLFHDFAAERVMILGGGPVGARKARRFDREATVVVVSPTFTDEDFGDATLVRARATPETVGDWLDRVDPVLVVAATDDENVNDAVTTAAIERGVLYNRANRRGLPGPGGVVVPATVREDPVVAAIATGGRAPALSKYLREQLEETFAGAGEMATLVGALHDELRDRDVPRERRRAIVTDLVTDRSAWINLRTGATNHSEVIEDVLEAACGREPGHDGADRRDAGGRP